MAVGCRGLLERDRELAELSGLADGTAVGDFGFVAIEGPAGAGKSVLLGALASRASSRGIRVLRATGLELECGVPFGVVRQLFEPAVAGVAVSTRGDLFDGAAALAEPLVAGGGLQSGGVLAEGGFSLVHGLYWLLSGVAELGPVALLVDDVQWCDAPSLRFLAFALKRGEELPLLVGVGRRDAPGGDLSPALGAVLSGVTSFVRPAPLSAAAISSLLSGVAGRAVGERVVQEALRLTGGNPLYVRELMDALGAVSDAFAADPVEALSKAAPTAVDRRVRRELARLESPTRALVVAAAVLGDGVPLRRAVALAGVGWERGGASADALVGAGILLEGDPLRFRHPLVREGVLESIGARARAELHRRAAKVLIGDGEPPERVAGHLLASDPAGDGWVVTTLRAAAAGALAAAAPELGVVALRRALREPPSREERPLVLKELALIETQIGDPAALDHFREAFATTPCLGEVADAAGRYGLLLCGQGRVSEAEAVVERAMEAVGDRERRLELEADLCTLSAAVGDEAARRRLLERLVRVTASLTGSTRAERFLLALRAHEAAAETPAGELIAMVKAALGDGRLLAEQGPGSAVYLFMVGALQWSDELDLAERELAAGLVEARRQGAAFGFAMISGLLAVTAHKRGRLLAAEADGRSSVEVAAEMGWLAAFPFPLSCLLPVLTDRGELAEADRLLEAHSLSGPLPQGQAFTELLDARGALRLAQGMHERGLADLEEFGRRLERERDQRANMWARWAKVIVPELVRVGRRQRAYEVATRALSLAESFGQPRFIAAGLRARALARAEGPDLAALAEAVAIYERIDAPLDCARTLLDIGAALRRGRQAAAARDPLRRSLDLARACGAGPLADRAEHELRAAGAKPRRDRITGRDALTATEHRVALLAAQGMTNRQIAQSLFVTRKTVDSHLQHVFRKLDVHSRGELENVLTGEEVSALVS